MKHHKAQGQDGLSCGAFKKGACVLAPVAFWANYPGLCTKWDGIKDQDISGAMALTFGVFETEKKALVCQVWSSAWYFTSHLKQTTDTFFFPAELHPFLWLGLCTVWQLELSRTEEGKQYFIPPSSQIFKVEWVNDCQICHNSFPFLPPECRPQSHFS